jgi:hypothetical protein
VHSLNLGVRNLPRLVVVAAVVPHIEETCPTTL